MPELPEVEVLVRHLRPALENRVIRRVQVFRGKVLAGTSQALFRRRLSGARFLGLDRRGKYLVFRLQGPRSAEDVTLVGHLGMTGRMYLDAADTPLPKHAAVVLQLDRGRFVYEDTRYFGRLTLDQRGLAGLGPEPLGDEFTVARFARDLARSRQAIKVRLLDQSLVTGVGNIYASEALFRARVAPGLAARRLDHRQIPRLHRAIRAVLTEAIECGSTVPLSFSGAGSRDGLFYFGRASGTPDFYEERLRVYDREGQPCIRCARPIRRIVQAARSTFYCPNCQPGRKLP